MQDFPELGSTRRARLEIITIRTGLTKLNINNILKRLGKAVAFFVYLFLIPSIFFFIFFHFLCVFFKLFLLILFFYY
jgi:hypothetical protein